MNRSRNPLLVLGPVALLTACSADNGSSEVELGTMGAAPGDPYYLGETGDAAGPQGVGVPVGTYVPGSGGALGSGSPGSGGTPGSGVSGTGSGIGSGDTESGGVAGGGTAVGSGGSTSSGPVPGSGSASGVGGQVASSGGGTTASSGGSVEVGTGGSDPSSCVPGVPESSQIPRLKNREYDNIVRDLLGVTDLAGANGEPPSSLLNTDSLGPMNNYMWQAYLTAAEMIASEVMSGPNRSKFIACDPATPGCLTDTITTFGRRAFRRPLTSEEVARFEALGDTDPPGTAEEVAETTLLAFLVSPSFLQINELSEEKEGDHFKLTGHEVATRLSLMIWGSIPDDELNQAADDDALATKEQILAQAERMFAIREKAGPQIAEFHRNYLALNDEAGHWFKVRPDPELYPLYSLEADPAMQAEIDLFFEEVAYSGGSFADLFLSNVGFVNQDTAALYGLDPGGYGPEMEKVELDQQQRPGFLTRLAFLSSHAHADSTSPILRGAFIAKNIIGTDQELIPDPNALTTPPPEGVFTTEREYVTALTDKPACKGCHHVYVNPPGFVLEAFDAAGSWQTTDPRGGAIDATADVVFGAETKTISTPLELMEEIAGRDFTRRSYTEKIVAAATGRLPNANDACLVDQLNLNLTTDGYSILDLFADITQAESFRLRNRAAN